MINIHQQFLIATLPMNPPYSSLALFLLVCLHLPMVLSGLYSTLSACGPGKSSPGSLLLKRLAWGSGRRSSCEWIKDQQRLLRRRCQSESYSGLYIKSTGDSICPFPSLNLGNTNILYPILCQFCYPSLSLCYQNHGEALRPFSCSSLGNGL